MRSKEINKELDALGLKKDLIPEKDGFKLPHGYFERMQAAVHEELGLEPPAVEAKPTEAKEGGRAWLLRQLWTPRLAMGLVALCLLVGAFWVLGPLNGTRTTNLALEEPTGEEALQYLIQHAGEFETDLLLELSGEDYVSQQIMESNEAELDEILDDYLEEADVEDILDLL